MQGKAPALFSLFFCIRLRGLFYILRQTGKPGFIINQQFIGIGRIEHIFGETRRQLRLLFLNFCESFFLLIS